MVLRLEREVNAHSLMLVTLLGINDAGQAGINERQVPDGGDRQVINRVWDGHCTTRTGVSRDGDRANVGCVI
jgi:hypothetical protein